MSQIVVYGFFTDAKSREVVEFLNSHNKPFLYQEVGRDVLVEEVELAVSRRVTSIPVITVNGAEVDFDYLQKAIEYYAHEEDQARLRALLNSQ